MRVHTARHNNRLRRISFISSETRPSALVITPSRFILRLARNVGVACQSRRASNLLLPVNARTRLYTFRVNIADPFR